MPTKTKATVAKKVVKKTVAKKVVAVAKKPVVKKSTAGKNLVIASSKQAFWASDGQIFNSLSALNDALAKMDKAVYAHHVTKDRHDFADWVEKVLRDTACAADLRRTKAPGTSKVIVARYLKLYQA